MKKQIRSILGHAFVMGCRNLKGYGLLSVTIVLSFSLLLGYLLLTDSATFNKYKDLFQLRREVVRVYLGEAGSAKAQVFQEKASQMEDTHAITIFQTLGSFETYAEVDLEGSIYAASGSTSIDVICVPDHTWGIFNGLTELNVAWLEGQERENITLAEDEILLSEGVYYGLGLDQKEAPLFRFGIIVHNGNLQNRKWVTMRVVGLVEDQYQLQGGEVPGVIDKSINTHYRVKVVASTRAIHPSTVPDAGFSLFSIVHSDDPEVVADLAETLGCVPDSVYTYQDAALAEIRTQKSTKAIIAAALLLILGINLYSSFTNAMNDRKYEIGVKRAIGASGWGIVRQFLYESMLVMVANILLSIALVTDVAIIYKLIAERTPNEQGYLQDYVLYLSPQSAAMFGICAVGLTVVFSLIFAYKSTRVEIVQYLKAE